ncbi:MAG TPA: D-2-hydroxyacid dehydrogenase [Flavobacteriales bacterium]|nr:D-2-hydroxyacid dehydrogenase [Flavobacteriales bacterium]
MAKILANDGIDKSGKDLLEKAGHTVITEKVAQADLINYVNANNIEVILVRSATTVRKDLFDACPSVKMVGRGGVGMDNIDVEYGRSKGVDVFNTPGASSQSVAELTMAHLFSLARFLHDSNKHMYKEGNTQFEALKKKYSKGFELRGKTLGIIGFGRIGQSLASYALGCGMNIIANDHHEHDVTVDVHVGLQKIPVKIHTTSLEAVIKGSDFISIHVPKQKDGKPIIGAAELAMMKKGVVLLNSARGGVIDETELLNALNSGQVAAAGLDVFEKEPTPRADLLAHPNICLTPHIGASTNEAQDRIGMEIAERIIKHYSKALA